MDLSFDELKAKTLYYIKFRSTDYTITGTLDQLPNENVDVKDFGRLSWENQPAELQDYYRAYDYAVYELGREDLLNHPIAFYNEYVADPKKFEAKKRKSLGLLADFIVELNDFKKPLLLENYDGYFIGNTPAGNIYEAVLSLQINFVVIQFYEGEDFSHVMIQCDDKENVSALEYEIKRKELLHDKFLGDGKYCN